MDYPAPQVGITADGKLDLSKAYATGMGAWDVQAIRYGYTEFAPGTDEQAGLDAILKDGLAHGLIFLTDEDARPEGSASPITHLWDNGAGRRRGAAPRAGGAPHRARQLRRAQHRPRAAAAAARRRCWSRSTSITGTSWRPPPRWSAGCSTPMPCAATASRRLEAGGRRGAAAGAGGDPRRPDARDARPARAGDRPAAAAPERVPRRTRRCSPA